MCGLVGRLLVLRGYALWGGYWDSSPTVLLSIPLPGHQEVRNCSIMGSPPWCAASPQAQEQRGQLIMAETSKTVSQNKPFLFISWLPQVFCYSNRKLINASPKLAYLFLCLEHSFQDFCTAGPSCKQCLRKLSLMAWLQMPHIPLKCCATICKRLNVFVPWLLHLERRQNNSTYFIELLWALNKVINK
jgi:hypothetical protein